MTGKRILIISPESWGISYLSKHHYALELARQGNEVWFLNSPFYKRDSAAEDIEKEYSNLHILDDKPMRGLAKMPGVLQRALIEKQVRQLQSRLEVVFDIVWSFDNSRYFLLDAFEGAVRIHHVVDTHMNYQLEKACKTADVCLAVTEKLREQCGAFNPNSYFIQHGYAAVANTLDIISKEGHASHACYVGNLLIDAFDAPLMFRMAQQHAQVCFHLIGSHSQNHLSVGIYEERMQEIEQLRHLPNVKLYGELTYDHAFTIAAQCDVLLLMYFNRKEEIGNSSKILPYLATGNIVLSDYIAEYAKWNVLLMAKSREDYLALFSDLLSNLSIHNRAENKAMRRSFALRNTYSFHLDQIEKIIQPYWK